MSRAFSNPTSLIVSSRAHRRAAPPARLRAELLAPLIAPLRDASLALLLVMPIALLAATTAADASEGALEINQTCAIQTGCFAGDTPGLPVTLTQPGSYRLTSNLTQALATTTVVRVSANDVSIDLGGFEIAGPFTCPGNPASCTAVGIGYAIDADAFSGVRVANGSVRGTARGINLGDHCAVDDVRVVETTNHGIFTGTGCALARVVVARNGSDGVQIDQGTIVDSAAHDNEGSGFRFGSNGAISNSSARRNGGSGISGNAGTSVDSCVSSDNVGSGISLNAGGVVTSSASYSNTASGIVGGTGSVVRFSSAYANGDRGIVLSLGSQAIGNSIRLNTGLGLVLADNSGYRENVLTQNNNLSETQVGVVLATDTIFNLGSNVCGTDTTCP